MAPIHGSKTGSAHRCHVIPQVPNWRGELSTAKDHSHVLQKTFEGTKAERPSELPSGWPDP